MRIPFIIPVFLIVLITSCSKKELPTVKSVDLEKYSGKWYEIASFPNRFQKGCSCTEANYFLEENHVKVVNKCRRGGELSEIEGKAFVVKNSNNTRLKVQFFWPFKGDYYIIGLGEDYSWALVGNPSRKYLWILARNKTLSEDTVNMIKNKAGRLGFDIRKLERTVQDCED